jgi:hypothetical protein
MGAHKTSRIKGVLSASPPGRSLCCYPTRAFPVSWVDRWATGGKLQPEATDLARGKDAMRELPRYV